MTLADVRTEHPLAMTTVEEVERVRAALAEAGLLGDTVRFAFFLPEEPPKAEVLGFSEGDVVDRRFRVALLDLASGRSWDTVVSATNGEVVSSRELDPATEGQPPIIDSEFMVVEEILNADPGWLAALEKRGIDPTSVRRGAAVGGRVRLPRRGGPPDPAFVRVRPGAREGPLLGAPDRRARGLRRPHHGLGGPASSTRGAGRCRRSRRATSTTPRCRARRSTPCGRSRSPSPRAGRSRSRATGCGWAKWDLRIGFNEREGLTLHQVAFDGRPIVYRASVAEMVVPYADPSPVRFWQNYFDNGEYMLARGADSLQLGCDCLGDIAYLDAVIADDLGAPKTIQNAICMHEEDYGVLWKHSDIFTGSRGDAPPAADGVLLLHADRQLRLRLLLVPLPRRHDPARVQGHRHRVHRRPGGTEYASQIAPGLTAPYHQHLFSARLDMTVDGVRNAVEEVEAQRVPMGPGNPYGNAFTQARTRLARESEAQRDADGSVGRAWQVDQPGGVQRGRAARRLRAAARGAARAAGRRRSRRSTPGATFAAHHLWVTAYDPAERYPAGDFVNQHPGGAGLPAWTAADRPIDGEDIVVWHTFGTTHFPRPEDWPVMPVDHVGFTLKPVGFFDRNPTLDVPAPRGHCG